MGEPPEEETPLNERLLDVLVYAPAGLLISVVEDLPRLAELGRQTLGPQISSARAVGQFAVDYGRRQIEKRSESVLGHRGAASQPAPGPTGLRSVSDRSVADGVDRPAGGVPHPAGDRSPAAPRVRPVSPVAPSSAAPASSAASVASHLPGVGELAIPAFDTLSASQVVQRLDGLSRTQLVTARAYEAGTRGRRTILSRIDQLLDERA
jgi:hypothetical protein